MFAVQLEHALQSRLANCADACRAQVFSDQQAEGSVAFDAPRRQARNALHAPELWVRRQQHVRAANVRREHLGGQAELVREHELLQTSIAQQRLELVAHRGQCQRVKRHTP